MRQDNRQTVRMLPHGLFCYTALRYSAPCDGVFSLSVCRCWIKRLRLPMLRCASLVANEMFAFPKTFIGGISLVNNARDGGCPRPSMYWAKNRWSARRRYFSGVPAQYLAQDFAKLQRVGSPAHFADGHRDFLPAGGLSPPQK